MPHEGIGVSSAPINLPLEKQWPLTTVLRGCIGVQLDKLLGAALVQHIVKVVRHGHRTQ